MTRWLDHVDLPEVLGEASVALAGVAAVCTLVVRDWRLRRRKFRQIAARLAYQPDGANPIDGGADELIRMTLLAVVDEPGEVEKAEAWLRANKDSLTFLSEEGGCGCCTVDWDMEGPRETIQTLPNSLRCGSPWTRRERNHHPKR